jgi:hypothetical protein
MRHFGAVTVEEKSRIMDYKKSLSLTSTPFAAKAAVSMQALITMVMDLIVESSPRSDSLKTYELQPVTRHNLTQIKIDFLDCCAVFPCHGTRNEILWL